MKVVINGVLYPKRLTGKDTGSYHRAKTCYCPSFEEMERRVYSNDNFMDGL